MTARLVTYVEPLGHGRGQLRVDLIVDGELELTYLDGSPAPLETVARHARTIELDR